MKQTMQSTILNKRFCVLLFLLLLCISECRVIGVGNSAESNSLLRTDGLEEDSQQDNFISRRRRSIDGEKVGSTKDSRGLHNKENVRDYSTDRRDGRSLGVFNDSEKAVEPSGINSSLPVQLYTISSQPSLQRSVTQGWTTPVTAANGFSKITAHLSTPVIVTLQSTKSSSIVKGLTPQSASAGKQATSSAPIPTSTRVVSTMQSTLAYNTPTHPASTRKIDPTTGGNVQGQEDNPEKKKKKTLFGFVTVEILIALLAGAACAVILVAFLVYRIKKRNEGSYELCEMVNYNDKGKDSEKEVFV